MGKLELESPSRAGSLPLVGSELAFDLANTSSGRGGPMHKEHLRSAEDVVTWARHARVLTPADGQRLAKQVLQEAALARALLQRTHELRDVIYRIGPHVAARGAAQSAHIHD